MSDACDAPAEPRWKSAFQARGCEGQTWLWLCFLTAFVPPPAISCEHEETPREWVCSFGNDLDSCCLPPITPPPRVGTP